MLQKELGTNKYVISHILDIFEELGLVTRQNGKVQPIPRSSGSKVNLEDSKTYMEFKETKEVQALLRDNIENIRNYVLQALE